ncbi:ANT(3'') family aminoglycoside nucleotidyltransferase [Roseateles aquatilis]|uniref:Aminoglycoside (3'') (9) adenylyltransferase n=1 Tax=Roseateles aquatilis TaxID=431061 RepID=A0A246IVY8_9BURK|nr:aminoglycoside adenylyltransferase family protein [Roseateles aquatilis]OWQ84383.1 ANT(3'') family aminoglycoside nucleotidyltransferase [Roseateles aquatilis]
MSIDTASSQAIAPIAAQLKRAMAVIDRHLAGTVTSVHLFGSAVDGGLKPKSDIDLLVTVGEAPSAATIAALMTDLLTASAPPGTDAGLRPLEVTVIAQGEIVPWRYPPRREMQFGEWLRQSLGEGEVEPPMIDPDLAIILTQLRLHSVNLAGPPATEAFQPVPSQDLRKALRDTLLQWSEPADWAGEESHIVLALCRIALTLKTGNIASKDAAARWLLERLPAEHEAVVRTAMQVYLGATDDLARRPDEVAAFIHFMTAECLRRDGVFREE